ncbi:MAG: beta-galactosidase [Chloroflexi bacterium]|nr:beta-galactosidase [Chloroflexota bacterium]OJV90165.1 MAG: beta-galactosidase [Chloroflexi bacterium 54-19]
MAKSLNLNRFELGVCYYPEQWPETMWADDFRRMREVGFSVIRIAEFAWTVFEPQEGTFSFDLFDRAIDLAHQHGLQVILGTPTATPPAWLTTKYPEVLNVTQAGVQYRHGERRHYNYNAPIYRELSARIVRRMAEHYGQHPAVIGWQIDNELNCETNVFYSAADNTAFREWVKAKYTTLDELNKAWGTVFWNQTFTGWEQVNLTGPTPNNSPNPHQALDEKRFISDSAISFARLQSEILREVAPDQWQTTNGLFGHLDSHKLTEENLDFFSYDSYPNFSTIFGDSGPDPLLDRKWSWNLSIARSISPKFCLMEQQSGPGGWVNRIAQPSPKPGQMRLWAYQSIGHGADMLLFFRWRTATFGTEIYWHGILNYDNRPNRRLKEAAQVGKELEVLGPVMVETRVSAKVAIVSDYDNEWDGELDLWHGPYTRQSVQAWFKVLQRRHIPVDSLYLGAATTLDDLSKYEVLIYPHGAILPEDVANKFTDYVKKGGTIVFGCRTGYKNVNGHCRMTPMPGPVADLCGVTVEDFTRIENIETAPLLKWRGNKSANSGPTLVAEGFNDILQTTSPESEILAEYAGNFYEGAPALVRHHSGKGQTYYYGAVFNPEVAEALVEEIGLTSPTAEWLELPQAVELIVRERTQREGEIAMVLNYSENIQTLNLNRAATNLLTGTTIKGKVELAPFDVIFLELAEPGRNS